MDGRAARKAGRRSRAPRAASDERRRELVDLLGAGLARVIERSPGGAEKLSDSGATRVELPGDAGLSVVAGGAPAGRGGA